MSCLSISSADKAAPAWSLSKSPRSGVNKQTSWWFQLFNSSAKNARQIGSFPQVGMKTKNSSNHHLAKNWFLFWSISWIYAPDPRMQSSPPGCNRAFLVGNLNLTLCDSSYLFHILHTHKHTETKNARNMLNRKNNAGHSWCYHPPAQFPNIAICHTLRNKRKTTKFTNKNMSKNRCARNSRWIYSRNLELHSLKLT